MKQRAKVDYHPTARSVWTAPIYQRYWPARESGAQARPVRTPREALHHCL